MKIKTFGYFIKEGIKSVINNRIMSVASIITVVSSLFIFGIFSVLVINVDNVVNTVQGKIEIKAFLKEDVTSLQENKLKTSIEKIEHISEINFESKKEALDNYKKQLGDNEDLVKGFEEDNPLPASFIIKVDKPENISFVSGELRKLDGIEKVNEGKEFVDKVISIVKLIKIGSFVLMLILALVSIFLIENTIKLTVYARRREIGIMKYIGATDWFIRWPFIVEGVILGLAGGLLATLMIYFGYNYVVNLVTQDVTIFSLVPVKQIIGKLSLEFSLLGVVIGSIGSIMSIRKFLVV